MTKTNWPLPFWIAHRGAGKLAPENTLAAFRVGAQHGYRAFECDVKLSSDEQPFLLHDDTLNRTTPERGTAGLRSWAELSRIDAGAWHSRGYAGETLPSLDAIARFCLGNGHALNLEIKPTTGEELKTGQVVGREVLRLWGLAALPLLSSFKPESLMGAAETAPDVPRALLLDSLKPGWLDLAKGLGCVGVIANYTVMDQATIEAIHGAGMKAAVYTVNDQVNAQWLIAKGIDGIITDAVDRFSPVR